LSLFGDFVKFLVSEFDKWVEFLKIYLEGLIIEVLDVIEFKNLKIKTIANNLYTQLLVLCVLGKSYGFSSGLFLFAKLVA